MVYKYANVDKLARSQYQDIYDIHDDEIIGRRMISHQRAVNHLRGKAANTNIALALVEAGCKITRMREGSYRYIIARKKGFVVVAKGRATERRFKTEKAVRNRFWEDIEILQNIDAPRRELWVFTPDRLWRILVSA